MQLRRGLSNPKQKQMLTYEKESFKTYQQNRKQQPSSLLENDTKKMEDKLNSLKEAMNKEKNKKEDNMRTSGSRWKTATAEQPIKSRILNLKMNSRKPILQIDYANKVLEKKDSTLTQQSSNSNLAKTTGKPPTLKIGNLTNADQSIKTSNSILKRPSIKNGSRPSSTQSSKSAFQQPQTGKENENNLNSSFRKSLNKSLNQSFENQQVSSMTQFTSQIDQDDGQRPQSSSSSLQNSTLAISEILERPKPQKMIQTKLTELNNTKPNNIAKQKPTAELNLLKHLNFQKELQKEVHQFLSSVNLLQYQQVFEDNGFDDIETILEISTEYMNSMKITAAHQIKIQNRIQHLNLEKKQVEELHREKELKDQQPESSKIKNKVLYPTAKKKNIEEIQTQPKKKDQQDSKPSSQTSKTSQEQGGELLKGAFNEEESHKSFLEALMEFRNQGKNEQDKNNQNSTKNLSITDERKKSVRFVDGVVDNERDHTIKLTKIPKKDENADDDGAIRGFGKNLIKQQTEDAQKEGCAKFSFFYAAGDSEWSNDAFPFSIETSTATDPNLGRLPKRDIDKISCWNCYKVVPLGTEKTFNVKNFCSTKCLSVYKGQSYITCICGKLELKDECAFAKGRWFCSEVCALELKDTPNVHKNNKYAKNGQQNNSNDDSDQMSDSEIDLDFGNNNTNNQKKILTLEQLEEKYKRVKDISPQKKVLQQKKK